METLRAIRFLVHVFENLDLKYPQMEKKYTIIRSGECVGCRGLCLLRGTPENEDDRT